MQPGREENRFPSRSEQISLQPYQQQMDGCLFLQMPHRMSFPPQEAGSSISFPFSNLFSCSPKLVKQVGRLCFSSRETFPYSCFSFVTEMIELYYLENTALVCVKGNCDCSHASGFNCLLFLILLRCFSFL